MWRAWTIPRHDIRPHKAVVRGRMAELERQIERIGRRGRGPGLYALGSARLALGETDAAVVDLERAWTAGYRAEEVAYTLGLAIGRQYAAALAHLGEIGDPGDRQAARRRLERELRDPAVAWLERSGGLALETPEYVQGLIALFDGRHQEALELARATHSRLPWHYEAKLLEGDTHLAMAEAAEDVHQPDIAAVAFATAEQAYREALEIAPSDPRCHLGLGRALVVRITADDRRGVVAGEDRLRTALEVVERALEVDPELVESVLLRVEVELARLGDMEWTNQDWREPLERALHWVEQAEHLAPANPQVHATAGMVGLEWANAAHLRGEDVSRALDGALASLRRAAELQPSARNHQVLGVALRRRAMWQLAHGAERRQLLEEAATLLRTAADQDPENVGALSGLAFVLHDLARFEERAGACPEALLAATAETYRRALSIRPGGHIQHNNLGIVLTDLARRAQARGEDPRSGLSEAAAAFTEAIRLSPGYSFALNNLGEVWRLQAEYELGRGEDPRPSLTAARAALERACDVRPGYASPHFNLAVCHRLEGELQWCEGLDPTAAFSAAEAAFRTGFTLRSGHAPAEVERARLYLVWARVAAEAGGSAESHLGAARAAIEAALAHDPGLEEARVICARVELERCRLDVAQGLDPAAALHACWQALEGATGVEATVVAAAASLEEARSAKARGEDSEAHIEKGLTTAARALAANPSLAEAEVVQARLWLLRATASGSDAGARAAEERAAASFERAIALDPRLRPRTAEELALARRLARDIDA